MSNTQKKQMSVVKKMIIALIGGLIVGLAFMFIRSSMLSSGNEAAWDIINKSSHAQYLQFHQAGTDCGTDRAGIYLLLRSGSSLWRACGLCHEDGRSL